MKKILTLAAIAALSGVAMPTSGHAQSYPSRAIKVIVPYGAGQGSEVMCRMVLDELKLVLKQPMVIENKPGAGTNLGAAEAAKSTPDGYTLLCTGSGTHIANPLTYTDMGFDPDKDLVPVSSLAGGAFAITVNNKWKGKTIQEIAEATKAPLRVGGASTSAYVLFAMIRDASKVPMTRVPYTSGNQGLFTDLMRSDVDIAIDALASTMGPVKNGLVSPLAVTTPQRVAMLDAPTLIQTGVNVTMVGWVALYAPKGTPADIVGTLNKAVAETVTHPELIKRLETIAVIPLASTSEGLTEMNLRDRKTWAPIVKELNLTSN